MILRSAWILQINILIGLVLGSSCNTVTSNNPISEIKIREEAFEYFHFRYLVEDFPNQSINDDAFYRAYQSFKESPVNNSYRNLSEWKSIGPSNIAGRSLCLAIHPLDTNVLWMGSAGAGLWKSNTGGIGKNAWTYVQTSFPVSSVSSIAIQLSNPDIIYIGTGEVYNFNGADGGLQKRTLRGSKGIGILKSIDGGQHWTLSLDWTSKNNTAVWKLIIHPHNSSVVYAATTHGVYRSVDGGATWKINLNLPMALDLLIDGEDPRILYAAIGGINSPEYGVYKTINNGINWTKIKSPNDSLYEGRIMLASYKKNPKKVFAAYADAFKSIGILRTSDRFDSIKFYTPIKDVTSYQGWYAKCLHVKDDDSSQLIMGGVDLYIDTTGTGNQLFNLIYRRIKIHADMHDIISNPFDPNKLYIATDGGLYRSDNFANSFYPCNEGYLSSQFYTGSLSSNGLHILAGLQDNRSAIFSGNTQWTGTSLGDGTYNAFDPNNDSILYASSQYQNLYKSIDFGKKWVELIPPNPEAAFVAPFTLCKSNPNRIYSGGNILLRSDNDGLSWDSIILPNKNEVITAIADMPACSDEIYFATILETSGTTKLYYSQDAGEHLLLIDNFIPERMIREIIVDPKDATKLYICLASYGRAGIMTSNNKGLTWNFLQNNNLPEVPMHCLLIDPNDSDILYAGSDFGLFYSIDRGDNWKSYNTHPYDLVPVYDLIFHKLNNELLIFTHSHGAYTVEAIDKKVVINKQQNKTVISSQVINKRLYLLGTDLIPNSVKLISSSGQIFTLFKSNNSFNLNQFAPGLYFVYANGMNVSKILIN